jgi:hypothetical protein
LYGCETWAITEQYKCRILHNKPTVEVHPGHMPTGPKEVEEMQDNVSGNKIYEQNGQIYISILQNK